MDDAQQSNPSPVREERGEEERESPVHRKPGSPPIFFGKHRTKAAISYLNSQINIIQGELDQVETLGESSIACKEFLSSVESIPDPLLPVTKGPTDAGWDRWFRGAPGARHYKRWI